MRKLKFILVSVYVILIVLLLLFARGCKRITPNLNPEPVTPVDTTNAVEQAEEIGQTGDLKVTLLWNFYADIDLHIKTPGGEEIYYKNRNDSCGGELDVDNRSGGVDSAENIYWANPPRGEYQVSLVYYGKSEANGKAESGSCKVVVFQKNKEPMTFTIVMYNPGDRKNVCTVTVE